MCSCLMIANDWYAFAYISESYEHDQEKYNALIHYHYIAK